MQTERLIAALKETYEMCHDELLAYFEMWLGAMVALTILGLEIFPVLATAYVFTIFLIIVVLGIYGITLVFTWKE